MQALRSHIIESKIDQALTQVRRILDATRNPQLASSVHHDYTDKFLLVNFVANASIASHVSSLSALGLNAAQLNTLLTWARDRTVTLRFRADEKCSFNREVKRDVESATKSVTEGSIFGSAMSLTSKVVTTVTEYFWDFEYSFEITAFAGVGGPAGDSLVIQARRGKHEMKTSSKNAPRSAVRAPAIDLEADITWLLRNLSIDAQDSTPVPCFSIDRTSKKCATPRRNPEVEKALEFGVGLYQWCDKVQNYFRGSLFSAHTNHKLDLSALNANRIFVPVLPLLNQPPDEADPAGSLPAPEAGEEAKQAESEAQAGSLPAATATSTDIVISLSVAGNEAAHGGSGTMLRVGELNGFLAEERRSLQEKCRQLELAFPAEQTGNLISVVEAVLVTTVLHVQHVLEHFGSSVDLVERMLHNQLVDAIGKVVTPQDFEEYMVYHSNKLFAPAYRPRPFCYAVRRSHHHSPEGVLTIEQQAPGDLTSMSQPAVTLMHQASQVHPMRFALNAAAEVTFTGDRHLHALLQHQFSNGQTAPLSLVARTRQFSSMIVMVGAISGPTSFQPKYAAIVQNKDELTIPLSLSTIPTPKEFKDAIQSLSPEMQGFAKAFRGMQLESTLFGVLVVQIKPQLEKVLNLDPDSLTKEIKLTQDLMELFIKYQIPSDLLSFSSRPDSETGEVDLANGGAGIVAAATDKLAVVRGHVRAMHALIEEAKKKEIQDRRQEASHANPYAQRLHGFGLAQPHISSEDEDDSDGSGGGFSFGGVGRTGGGGGGGGGGFSFGAAAGGATSGASMDAFGVASAGASRSGFSFGGNMGGRNSLAPQPGATSPAYAPSGPASASSGLAGGLLPPAGGVPSGQQSDGAQQTGGQTHDEPTPQQPHQSGSERSLELVDYTKVPKQLEARYEAFDEDSALRPTIIKAGDIWTKKAKAALLAPATMKSLYAAEQKQEKDAAFDLLDALTRSGALSVEHAALHVVIAATHCFDKSLMDTVIQNNLSPIEKVERSQLIMASTIHQARVADLLESEQLERVMRASPMLLDA